MYFMIGRPSIMTYTETMVARNLGAYVLSLLVFIVLCLLLLKEMHALFIIGIVINLLLALGMIINFVITLLRPK